MAEAVGPDDAVSTESEDESMESKTPDRRAHGYWVEERIREEARNHPSKTAFKRACAGAYAAAHRLGIVDTLFEGGRSRWTPEAIRVEAGKYGTIWSFAESSQSAYRAARQAGLLPELFPSARPHEGRPSKWLDARVREEAAKHASRTDFARACPSAYQAAARAGLIDELFPAARVSWTEELIREAAANCRSSRDLARSRPGAHQAARRLGILKSLTFSIDKPKQSGDA